MTKLYWRSLSGDTLAETDGSGSLTNTSYAEYVFFAGRRIASRVNVSSGASPNVSIFYYFADQLGSTRTITTGSGKNADGSAQTPGLLCYDQDYTPYGQEIFSTMQMTRLQTTACPTNYKFTGYERDSETGLDYAFARYYSSRLGRFVSTDPLGGSVGSLQSHNAYAYVLNNPMNLVDPTGMTCYQPEYDPYGNGNVQYREVQLNKGDCQKSGFLWIDDVNTTVTVSGGGGDGGSPAGGCASFYQDGVYIGDTCGGPTSGGSGNQGGGGFFSGILNRTKIVNRCAGQLSQAGSVTNLSGGCVPEVLGSNTFGDIASLATGGGGFDQGAALAADATAHAAPAMATQVAVGTVTSIGKAISKMPGVYNPVTIGTTTRTLGMTSAGKFGIGFVEGVLTGKVLLDTGVYIGALVVCSVQ